MKDTPEIAAVLAKELLVTEVEAASCGSERVMWEGVLLGSGGGRVTRDTRFSS